MKIDVFVARCGCYSSVSRYCVHLSFFYMHLHKINLLCVWLAHCVHFVLLQKFALFFCSHQKLLLLLYRISFHFFLVSLSFSVSFVCVGCICTRRERARECLYFPLYFYQKYLEQKLDLRHASEVFY